MKPPVTPDGRYIVVDGRLWRASDPRLSPEARQALVDLLMDARRAVRAALKADDRQALAQARSRVQAAKEGLGERGPIWWNDGASDLNRRPIVDSPYFEWWREEGSGEVGSGPDKQPGNVRESRRNRS